MKRCPECRRDYYDDTLLYCLDDGNALLDGPAVDITKTLLLADRTLDQPTQILKAPSTPSDKSIAVLPFVNMSADPENEYFCDGLAEELLNALTKIEGLKVAARTSSFSFKGTRTDVATICQQLGVRYALEGSVRKSGERLRITVQMIDTSDGYQLWSERYDRQMRDIFEIQDEITLAIVDALKVKLLGANRSALLKKATVNSEAFELYLRARAQWNRRTREGFEKAIDHLEEAIGLDPDYALAYAGLADCYSFLAYFEWFAPSEMAPKAKMAVEKALELDPGLAECHAAMATFKLYFEFDFEAAGNEYLAAIAISPGFPQAHYLYCSTLAATGRFDEAINQGFTAVGLDPLSPLPNMTLGRALCYAGRCEEAADRVEKCFEIAPLWFFNWILGVAYAQMGEFDRSIQHFRENAATAGFRVYSYLGDALIRGGRPDDARRLLDELKASTATVFVSPVASAVIEAELGNMSRGLDLLEEAWQIKVIHLMWAGVDNVFDVFRDEPRFKVLLRQIGLRE